ncbi:MAG: cupin domain-containing protein [Planctomycetaceae bacterium]|nr:cupin domain-containing protein [Planctomycetaceae bacterium]
MTTEKRVIRLERNGPPETGMPKMKCDPAGFQSPVPTQHFHVYFEDEGTGMSVGVWESGPMVSKMKPFPVHEFGRMLEGEVTTTEVDGSTQTIRADDCFFVPKGTVCSWSIPDRAK